MISRSYSTLYPIRTVCNSPTNKVLYLGCFRKLSTTKSKSHTPRKSIVWGDEGQHKYSLLGPDDPQFTELLSKRPNDNLVSWGNLFKTSLKKSEQLFQRYFETFKKLGGIPSSNMYSQLVELHIKQNYISKARELVVEMARLKFPVALELNLVLRRLIEQNGLDSGISLKEDMLKAGINMPTSVYAILLNKASKLKRMAMAEQLLQEMKNHNLPLNIVLVDTLITGYFRERNIEGALYWFNQISRLKLKPTVVTYTAIIQGYINNGHLKKAEEWLAIMKESKCKPNVYTYTSLIHAYSSISLERVNQLWEEMIQSEIQPNSITYKSFVNAHIFHQRYTKVIEIFEEMKRLRTFPDTIWLNTSLNTLLKNHQFPEIMKIFQDIKDTELVDIVTYNIVLNCYLKQGNSNGALELFQEMRKHKFSPDTSTFNTLLHGLVKLEDFINTEKVHQDMCKLGVKADAITLNIMTLFHVKTNGVKFALSQLQQVYQSKDRVSQLSINPYNTLLACSISDPLNNGIMDEIWKQLESQNVAPDIRTYNLILRNYLNGKQNESFHKTLQLIQDKNLSPDTVTLNLKLEYSLSRNDISQIERILGEFRRYRIRPSTETWNVILTGFFNMKKYSEVLKRYENLRQSKKFLPTLPTYSVVMNTYNHLGQHDMVESIFKEAEKEPRLNHDLAPLISVMLDSAGFNSSLSSVKGTWNRVKKYPLTLNNWNAYFEALLRHKDFCYAIEEFKTFLQSGKTPDLKTARTIVLPFLADAHLGTTEVLKLFKSNTPELFSTFPDSWKRLLNS